MSCKHYDVYTRIHTYDSIIEYESTKLITHDDIHIRRSYNTRPQSRIQYYTAKHNFVTGFINRPIGLDEDGVTFVHVFDVCRLVKIDTRQAARRKFVSSRRGLADLTERKQNEQDMNDKNNKKFIRSFIVSSRDTYVQS